MKNVKNRFFSLTENNNVIGDYDRPPCVKLNLGRWARMHHGVKQSFTFTAHLTLSYNDCNGDRNFPCIPVLMSLYHNIFLGTVSKALRMTILLYADDIAVIAPDESKLQLMLNEVAAWCQDWKLQINRTKTQIMHSRNASYIEVFSCLCLNVVNHIVRTSPPYTASVE
jgi:hypothetical protein